MRILATIQADLMPGERPRRLAVGYEVTKDEDGVDWLSIKVRDRREWTRIDAVRIPEGTHPGALAGDIIDQLWGRGWEIEWGAPERNPKPPRVLPGKKEWRPPK